MLTKGARWTALENEDFCLSRAQEEWHRKPPRLAVPALSSPVLAGSRKEREDIAPLHALAKELSSTQVTTVLPIPRQKANRNNSFYASD